MASQYPLMSNRLGLFDAPVTLAEILQSAGYITAAFNAANPWVSRYFQYQRGFDIFEDFIASMAGNLSINVVDKKEHTLFQKSLDSMAKFAKSIIPENSNFYKFLEHWKVFLKGYATIHLSIENKRILLENFNKKILGWIESNNQSPFFLWIHLMDTHYPYIPLGKYLEELNLENFGDSEIKKIAIQVKHSLKMDAESLQCAMNLYDGAIKELDFKVGSILNQLKTKGFYKDSIIIFTADHGEEFFEHRGLKHTSKLFEELIHVPFIINIPGFEGGLKVKTIISHLDLLPTLCGLLEINWEESNFCGSAFNNSLRSVLAQQKNFVIAETIYNENGEMPTDQKVFDLQRVPKIYSLRTAKWKLIRDSVNGPTYLFDLQEDEKEQINLINRHKDIVTKLDEILKIHVNKEMTNMVKRF